MFPKQLIFLDEIWTLSISEPWEEAEYIALIPLGEIHEAKQTTSEPHGFGHELVSFDCHNQIKS